jgi:hypothetical protein
MVVGRLSSNPVIWHSQEPHPTFTDWPTLYWGPFRRTWLACSKERFNAYRNCLILKVLYSFKPVTGFLRDAWLQSV